MPRPQAARSRAQDGSGMGPRPSKAKTSPPTLTCNVSPHPAALRGAGARGWGRGTETGRGFAQSLGLPRVPAAPPGTEAVADACPSLRLRGTCWASLRAACRSEKHRAMFPQPRLCPRAVGRAAHSGAPPCPCSQLCSPSPAPSPPPAQSPGPASPSRRDSSLPWPLPLREPLPLLLCVEKPHPGHGVFSPQPTLS